MEFFNQLSCLHISFDENINFAAWLSVLNYAKSLKASSHCETELAASFLYEGCRSGKNQIDQLLHTESHSINEIHHIICPKCNLIRNAPIAVVEKYQSSEKHQYMHIGMDQSDINIGLLQEIVDKFYEYNGDLKPIIGFICYLLYVRVHPSLDGNGRTGRFLFIDNPKLEDNFFPIIDTIIGAGLDEKLISIYRNYTNFPARTFEETIPQAPSSEEYYKLKVDEKLIKKITQLLYTSKIYSFLIEKFPNLQKWVKAVVTSVKFCKKLEHHTNPGFAREIGRLIDLNSHIQYLTLWSNK